jgi:hypothetical protein
MFPFLLHMARAAQDSRLPWPERVRWGAAAVASGTAILLLSVAALTPAGPAGVPLVVLFPGLALITLAVGVKIVASCWGGTPRP